MNKVITINLNGVAYQLEEAGYEALRDYLDTAARRLKGNPDKDEIVTDIEQSIADKFRALLGSFKTVVAIKEVAAVLEEMGPVQADTTEAEGEASPGGAARSASAAGSESQSTTEPGGVKRLFRIHPEGAMLFGVCNGLGAYFGLDPTVFRIAFVLLTLVWGVGLLVYGLLVLVVPRATTSAEKAAASGAATTAQEFIKRAREGYYEGMKSFHDKASRRAWKRKFKQDMRSWKYGFHRDMAEHARQWQGRWSNQSPPLVGPVFLAPLLSLLLFALAVALIYAIYSLATAGGVFGVALPANMPLWVGILLLVILYQFVAWPIKAARYSCYYQGPQPCLSGPFGGLLGSLVGLFFLAFGIWMLDRHVPEFHEWLVQLPDLLHRLIDTVQGWFAQRR